MLKSNYIVVYYNSKKTDILLLTIKELVYYF